jgi:hypothetical protein
VLRNTREKKTIFSVNGGETKTQKKALYCVSKYFSIFFSFFVFKEKKRKNASFMQIQITNDYKRNTWLLNVLYGNPKMIFLHALSSGNYGNSAIQFRDKKRVMVVMDMVYNV